MSRASHSGSNRPAPLARNASTSFDGYSCLTFLGSWLLRTIRSSQARSRPGRAHQGRNTRSKSFMPCAAWSQSRCMSEPTPLAVESTITCPPRSQVGRTDS
jgi:hypothetical protein